MAVNWDDLSVTQLEELYEILLGEISLADDVESYNHLNARATRLRFYLLRREDEERMTVLSTAPRMGLVGVRTDDWDAELSP